MATMGDLQAKMEELNVVNMRLAQELTDVQNTLANAQARFATTEAQVIEHQQTLQRYIAENQTLNTRIDTLTATRTTIPSHSRDLESRILKTDLLKSKEIPSFNPKDNFEVWSDSFKNDLYAKLPEAKQLSIC